MLQTYLLTLFFPLFAGGNALINSKAEGNLFFSKDYTTVLKGLCCLIVIYVHFKQPFCNALQDAIGSFGYVCVTIFFLISAYGMMLGAELKENYLRNFWRNRLTSLLIPALLINIVSFILGFINNGVWLGAALYQINGYVAVLLQWCVWFYIVMWCRGKWFPEKKILTDWILIVGVFISSLLLYFLVYSENSAGAGWCFERIGLIWGVLLYRYFDKLVLWMNNKRIPKIILLFILGGLLDIAYLKYKYVFFLWGVFTKNCLGFYAHYPFIYSDFQ
ncbi:MAG: hypothetical protein IKP73_04935 [Bacteroidales bacterium]|nr:hypothetical protein [Bacteroidales bacterium]